MKIKFLGASGTVTGSAFLLHEDGKAGILVDFGMFQGESKVMDLNFQAPGFDIEEVQAVILTHAHLDHCGRLPLLAKMGYRGKIYMTEATVVLTELTLLDAAKVARESANN